MELLSQNQPDFPLSNKKSTFEEPNILNSNAKTMIHEANWFTSSNYKAKVGIYSKFTDIFLQILSNNFNFFTQIFSETCESRQQITFSSEKELIFLTKQVLLDSLNQINDIISVYDLKKTVLLQDVTGLNYKLISKLTSIVAELEEFLEIHKEKWINPIEKPYKTLKNWFIVSTDLFQRFVQEINFNLRLFDPKSNITQKLKKSRQLLSILVMLIDEISVIFIENSKEDLITLISNYKIQEINDLENIVQRLSIEKIKSSSPLSLFENFNFVLKPSNLSFIDSAKDKQFLCNVANKYKKISVMRFAEICQQENKRKNFAIEMPDFFKGNCQYKYLHYFKPFSKYLILFDISMIQKEINLDNGNYMKIPLNISFDLAYDNKSLITPDGEIYLSSGKFSEKDLFKPNDSFFLLDYEHVTLVEQQKMPLAKKFHAMNYLKKCIFIVGGKTDERKCTSECEKYEIITKKWRRIANLNEPVSYPSVTSFGDKYLFKFGGINQYDFIDKTIERYDIANNSWWIVRYSDNDGETNISLLYQSLTCQINEKQIVIFGGRNMNGFKVDSFLVFDVNDEEKSTLSKTRLFGTIESGLDEKRNILSFCGDFHENSQIIFNKSIYYMRKDYLG